MPQAGAKNKENTLFYLSLVAFGEEFISLDQYVERHVANMSLAERKIVICLAVAHYYGRESINAQRFADLLELPRKMVIELEKALKPSTLNLLVRDSATNWRPLHYLISQKILEICLTGPCPGERKKRATPAQNSSRYLGADSCAHCRTRPNSHSRPRNYD